MGKGYFSALKFILVPGFQFSSEILHLSSIFPKYKLQSYLSLQYLNHWCRLPLPSLPTFCPVVEQHKHCRGAESAHLPSKNYCSPPQRSCSRNRAIIPGVLEWKDSGFHLWRLLCFCFVCIPCMMSPEVLAESLDLPPGKPALLFPFPQSQQTPSAICSALLPPFCFALRAKVSQQKSDSSAIP